ncbi:hypothetical protein DPMN_160660 [Dreissena polymorpha]|uniref:Cryptic/Cripto CFC domain-containing protein n=1 Tax=Dreissena polymorpha TaxID=45954 RepID=A0A9D4EQN6_DREPO|nr:hypothetical protein DPMN_160660 [Dreissena polymorpha]
MNSFCHCPEPFYGRCCEKKVRHRTCGTIRHGTWMASGCHLCHCFDGNMRCKATTIPGCEQQRYVEGYENNPDYLVDLESRIPNADDFYQEYEYKESDVHSAHDNRYWLVGSFVVERLREAWPEPEHFFMASVAATGSVQSMLKLPFMIACEES